MPWPISASATERRPAWLAWALAVLTLLYPLLIFFGMTWFEPRVLAVLLLCMALLRALTARQPWWWWVAAFAALLALSALLGNQLLPLKLYPVLVSLVLLAVFGYTLIRPPTMIERIARLQEPDLPESGVRYTRRVTEVWCGFFVCNGAISLATALSGSEAAWALYNGLISYLLIGALFAGEWLVRRHVRARHG